MTKHPDPGHFTCRSKPRNKTSIETKLPTSFHGSGERLRGSIQTPIEVVEASVQAVKAARNFGTNAVSGTTMCFRLII